MSAGLLVDPSLADFELPVARAVAVADDEMVREPILPAFYFAVISVEYDGVAGVGAAVVNYDVTPVDAAFGERDGRKEEAALRRDV